jgi:hypothetical protein
MALAALAALTLSACGEAVSPAGSDQGGHPPVASSTGSTQQAGGIQGVRKVFDQPHTTAGKPLTFFMGGQFCPFCAAMRWPLVKALQRFGTFSGLGEMHSRPGEDGFQSIATHDFAKSTYESQYLTLRLVEAADANGNALQQPDQEQAQLVNQFDPRGSIPFLFVGGQYVFDVPYSPGLLQGKSYAEIKAEIDSANPGQIGQAVDKAANELTALICKTDGAQPASVCNDPAVLALTQQAS